MENWLLCQRSQHVVWAHHVSDSRLHEFVQGLGSLTIGVTKNARGNHFAEVVCCADSCNRNSFGGYSETKAILAGIT
jgi:hypothetical protein